MVEQFSLNISDASTSFNETNSTNPELLGYAESIGIQAVWGVISVVGAVGNILVIYTMGQQGNRSATSYYIINLALADLAFVTISFTLTSTMFASKDWLLGAFMCKLANYLILVTLHAACIILTAMTIDRYFAIVYPIRSINRRTPKTSFSINLCIWIASLMVCIPYLILNKQVQEFDEALNVTSTYCHIDNKDIASLFSVIVVLTTYIFPLMIIIVCYSMILKHLWKNRSIYKLETDIPMHYGNQLNSNPQDRRRRKVTKMVAIVVILFATFWFPIHAYNLCFIFITNFPRTKELMIIRICCLTLSYASSCVNPIVYAFMGDGFRRSFRRAFSKVPSNQRASTSTETKLSQISSFQSRMIRASDTSAVTKDVE